MSFEFLQPVRFVTADLPGIGGHIKQQIDDFEVEEIPAYQPCGEGDFLYLWVEKRDMGAEYFVRQIAQRLAISQGEVGTAGLKDRHAVTRQMVSVPSRLEGRLPDLEGDGIRVLQTNRHGNKLRPGHLHGNRFRILIRNVGPEASTRLERLISRLTQIGLPNYYGPQRFGKNGETLTMGLAMLTGRSQDGTEGRASRRVSPFVRKLALSAVQSALFNQYLSRRISDQLFRQIIDGDVMAKWPFGGLFVAQNVEVEQGRFNAHEIVHSGPIFGRKMFAAANKAAGYEQDLLNQAGISVDAFRKFGKLLLGTRRHNVVYVNDLSAAEESEGIRLSFTLSAGSYATVLLAELMKIAPEEVDDEA